MRLRPSKTQQAVHPSLGYESTAWTEAIIEHRLFSSHPETSLLTAAALGARMQLSARQCNLLLLELGWIQKGVKGWQLTPRGQTIGGVQEEYPDSGVPYVRWPASLQNNPVLIENLRIVHAYAHLDEATAERDLFVGPEQEIALPGNGGLRALDGHVMHSKAQLMICHWLYMSEIVHAFHRRLPVEGDYLCDFYLPSLHLYIEYWGDETEPGQLSAKLHKKEIYERHGLRLLELAIDDLQRLDEVLPRKLLKYGLAVY